MGALLKKRGAWVPPFFDIEKLTSSCPVLASPPVFVLVSLANTHLQCVLPLVGRDTPRNPITRNKNDEIA